MERVADGRGSKPAATAVWAAISRRSFERHALRIDFNHFFRGAMINSWATCLFQGPRHDGVYRAPSSKALERRHLQKFPPGNSPKGGGLSSYPASLLRPDSGPIPTVSRLGPKAPSLSIIRRALTLRKGSRHHQRRRATKSGHFLGTANATSRNRSVPLRSRPREYWIT